LQENFNRLDLLQNDLLKENKITSSPCKKNFNVPIMDYVFEIPFIKFWWEKQVVGLEIN
jgi:hypothetical protein